MHQADTTEAQASTTLPSPEMPAMPQLGQRIRLTFPALTGWDPEAGAWVPHTRIAEVVHAHEDGQAMAAYPDGAVELFIIRDNDPADPEWPGGKGDEGALWTLFPSQLAGPDPTVTWELLPAHAGDVDEVGAVEAAGAFRCEACDAGWPTPRQSEFCADADYALAEDRRAGIAEEAWDDARRGRDAAAVRS